MSKPTNGSTFAQPRVTPSASRNAISLPSNSSQPNWQTPSGFLRNLHRRENLKSSINARCPLHLLFDIAVVHWISMAGGSGGADILYISSGAIRGGWHRARPPRLTPPGGHCGRKRTANRFGVETGPRRLGISI